MENLYAIVRTLHCLEVDVLRNFLQHFSSRKTESELKSLKLLDLIINSDEIPGDETLFRKIYGRGGKDEKQLAMLKSRLRGKVLETLLLDINLDRKGMFDEAVVWKVKIKKKLAAIHLLLDKGDFALVHKVLLDIIPLAKQYEIYPELIEALTIYRFGICLREGSSEFDQIGEEIKKLERCRRAFNRSQELYYKLLMKTVYTGNPDEETMEVFLRNAVNELRDEFAQTQAPSVHYYLKLLEYTYCNVIADYNTGRDMCFELLDIVTKNKSVGLRRRIGAAYDYLSEAENLLGNYDKAVIYARNATEYFTPGTVNHIIAREHEFHATYLGRRFEEALNIAEELTTFCKKETGSFRSAKYEYYKICALFMQGRHKEAAPLLQQSNEINKDKPGWNISLCLLTIMNSISLQLIEVASMNIENLKKHIGRSSKEVKIRERDRVILKMLHLLEHNGFMFSGLGNDFIQLLDKLYSQDKELRWDKMTNELVPFHVWVEARMEEHDGKKRIHPRPALSDVGVPIP